MESSERWAMSSGAGAGPTTGPDGDDAREPPLAGVGPVRGVAAGLLRYPALDGWRGISIIAVISAHWLPLGPSSLRLNDTAGLFGMALFFTLSGFLITSTLMTDMSVRRFSIRRVMRVVPLAWFYTVLAALIVAMPFVDVVRHLFFVVNYPPYGLSDVTAHLWSLCVEMHFYLAMAVAVAIFRRRVFALIPWVAIAITTLRIVDRVPVSIATHHRVDEILAGAWLAVALNRSRLELSGRLSNLRIDRWRVPLPVLIVFFFLTCSEDLEPLMYLRPYAAAALVGATIVRPTGVSSHVLGNARLRYVAEISFALYVFHPLFSSGFMESGSHAELYAKRIPAALLTWAAAHVSTRYFESRMINVGKRWAGRTSTSSA